MLIRKCGHQSIHELERRQEWIYPDSDLILQSLNLLHLANDRNGDELDESECLV